MSGFVRIDFDVGKEQKKLEGIAREQLPFALAHAITRTAIIGQKILQKETHDKFQLHSPWIPRNIRVIAAKKKDVVRYGFAQAIVHTTPKIGFMSIHEKGGTKRPRGRALSLPSDGLGGNFKTATGKIKSNMRPAALLKQMNAGNKAKKGKSTKPKPFVNKGMILVRVGKDRYPLRVMYKFEAKAQIKPRWEFEGTLRAVVGNHFANTFNESMKLAISTAKVKK